MAIGITFTIPKKEEQKIVRLTKFPKVFRKHLSHTLRGFGSYAMHKVRTEIRNGSFEAQGPAQVIIKGHGSVLRMSGALHNAVKFKYIRSGSMLGIEVFIEDKPVSSGSTISMPQLASILHNGKSWTPTQAERAALAKKIRSAGGGPPSGSPQPRYNIPARPFLVNALNKPEVFNRFGDSCGKAIGRAINELKLK